ncbi:MAG: 1,4-dihydroxy-6-naphthoate synthase [Deltaproteobacteria bacterium]|nr:1,4-dihydroxy-6-naphthoate synthase [Deltaproteobacteria bacterium]
METIPFGFSPCPNDTFAFHALVHGLAPGVAVTPHLADVEELNRLALTGELPLTKLSFHALARVRDRYRLLNAGAALGRGCGPLVVARPGFDPRDLGRVTVAAPGRLTTAHLLLALYLGRPPLVEPMLFSRVMERVAAGDFAAGLIIHEGRFTYPSHGLTEVVDLGRWWEEATGLPIPLGAIAARRDLGEPRIARLEEALAASVAHAFAHPGDSRDYVAAHAQEMDPTVQESHIALYVNHYTLDLGAEGRAAVDELFRRADELAL